MMIVIAGCRELDAATTARLDAQFAGIDPRLHVTVDMTHVTFSDVRGLRPLLDAALRHDRAGGRLTLASPSPQIVRLLDLAGLTRHFTVLPGGLPASPKPLPAAGPRRLGRAVRSRPLPAHGEPSQPVGSANEP